MRPPFPPFGFEQFSFGTELLFTIVAVFFCFEIYRKTHDSYELSRHKGIRYFRDAFLFFGLSYLVRFLFNPIMASVLDFDFVLPRGLMILLFLLPLGYFSTAAIFYLIFSSVWKRFDNKKMLMVGHGIAVLLPLASLLTGSRTILLYLQTALLLLAAVLSHFAPKGGGIKKLSQTRILYILISALWLINLWIVDRVRPSFFGVDLFFQVVSIIVFIVIYYKVSKWAK